MKKIIDFLRKIGVLHLSSGDNIGGEYDDRKDLKDDKKNEKEKKKGGLILFFILLLLILIFIIISLISLGFSL
jgi:hypothetical protein